ncbi:MAG TPA: hypothetical protein VE669_07655, partial [Actinomycetota bacterium]|nr:hypothetical protein [Actinomycetota bacterium]
MAAPALRARFVWLAVSAMVVAQGCTASPSGAPSRPPETPNSASASPTGEPVQRADHLRLRAPDGGTLLVRGTYPRSPSRCVDPERPRLLARYPGDLSIDRSEDGTMALTVTVSFDRYLEGIAEVPP